MRTVLDKLKNYTIFLKLIESNKSYSKLKITGHFVADLVSKQSQTTNSDTRTLKAVPTSEKQIEKARILSALLIKPSPST